MRQVHVSRIVIIERFRRGLMTCAAGSRSTFKIARDPQARGLEQAKKEYATVARLLRRSPSRPASRAMTSPLDVQRALRQPIILR